MPTNIPKIPNHVGFIMDGNRRWSRANGKNYEQGYNQAMDVLEALVSQAAKRGVKFVTTYTFSTENWNRPKIEIDLLMRLFEYALMERIKVLHQKNVKFQAIGRLSDFSPGIQKRLREETERTKANTGVTLTLALNYGGHAEIIDTVNRLVASGKRKITEADIQQNLYDPSLPPVDLIVRTSGEKRISGFMLWEADYAELYFLEKNWPELTPEDFDSALEDYAQRKRNFGA
ncbi:MAG: polyprenyl diphosphate synthase [Patescibacteria group bacterium]